MPKLPDGGGVEVCGKRRAAPGKGRRREVRSLLGVTAVILMSHAYASLPGDNNTGPSLHVEVRGEQHEQSPKQAHPLDSLPSTTHTQQQLRAGQKSKPHASLSSPQPNLGAALPFSPGGEAKHEAVSLIYHVGVDDGHVSGLGRRVHLLQHLGGQRLGDLSSQ